MKDFFSRLAGGLLGALRANAFGVLLVLVCIGGGYAIGYGCRPAPVVEFVECEE